MRAFVRIEKLDRIPGALGVEIVRTRLSDEALRLRPVDAPLADTAPRPRVVYLAPALAAAREWRDALAAWKHPFVLCLGAAAPQPAARTEAQRRIGLLEIEQAAWALADGDPRFGVASTRTELDWAMKSGRLSVWAPSHMAAAAVGVTADASEPVALAAWLAEALAAEMLVVAGADAPPQRPGLPVRSAVGREGTRSPGIGGCR